MLIDYASKHGIPTQWNTRLVSFTEEKESDTVLALLEDTHTSRTSLVRCKYLAAADGVNSGIVRDLGIPMVNGEGSGSVISAWVEADLSHLCGPTPTLLNYLSLLDKPQPNYGPVGIAHFIEPWKNWVLSLFPHPSYKQDASDEMIMDRIKELIGDDTVEYNVKGIKTWVLKNFYAKTYSKGNVYCVGNAVHQHPPFGGLGTSTCLEDSFNLGWKLAHVLQGKAGKSLLASYNDERQPAGEYVVARTSENGRMNFGLYGMMGYFGSENGLDTRSNLAALLKEDSPEGEEHRNRFRKSVQGLADERHNVGAVMNQWYKSSAVYAHDEQSEPEWPKTESERSSKLYTSTHPGWRIPHVWLGVPQKERGPRKPLISTRDIVGHGKFVLLTGIGGKSIWSPGAEEVSRKLGIQFEVLAIGFGQDYEDTFFRWHEVRGVGEHGAVLVRPDRTVVWRSYAPPTGGASVVATKLEDVLSTVLGRKS